jgi:hypothetical protein
MVSGWRNSLYLMLDEECDLGRKEFSAAVKAQPDRTKANAMHD